MELFIIIASIVLVLYITAYTLNLFYQHKLMRKEAETGILFEVRLEKDSEQDPFSIEQLWSSFHGLYLPWYKRLFKAQPFFSFEIKSEHSNREKRKDITFNIWVPRDYANFVRQRILAIYPAAEIVKLKKDYIPSHEQTIEAGGFLTVKTAELGLQEDSAFALKTFDDYETDPLASVTSALTDLDNRETAVVQIVAQPVSTKWRRKAIKVLERYEKTGRKPTNLPEWTNFFSGFLGFAFGLVDSFLNGLFQRNPEFKEPKADKSTAKSAEQKDMFEKTRRLPYSFQVRLMFATPYDTADANSRIRDIVASFNDFEGEHNGLRKEVVLRPNKTLERMRNRHLHILDNDDIITTKELAGLAHLPNKNMKTPGLKKILSKKKEAPVNLADENPFAVAQFRDGQQLVGLDEKARMRHAYVTGMTGTGKSTLLENMIINDIESGNGVTLIDPHGELVDVILSKISSKREDIYVLDPSDLAWPFGMNLLEIQSDDPLRREMEKVLVIDSYITVMKRVFSEGAIGPNTDDLFRMSCSAILDSPEGGGLLEMVLMLTSERYRDKVVPFIVDPIVKQYWEVVFPTLAGEAKFQTQNMNAPLNKLRRFIANGLVSNIICQKKSTLNIADAINSGAVILARFSRGDMGFENSALLGSMLISKIQIASMQRVNIPENERVPTYLYVDEFQNFIGDASGAKSFAEILSEARKYRLGLVKMAVC